jgi:pimeloyl-ACP methyl ester carboxylesterase
MSCRMCVRRTDRGLGPWGTKIQRLAKVATERGFDVDSIDYRGVSDPVQRAQLLVRTIKEVQTHDRVLLVGSSMGGYVAMRAAVQHTADSPALVGMFLMAPALYMKGYPDHGVAPKGVPVFIVHGANDDVVPASHSERYAAAAPCQLKIIDDGHRLVARLDQVVTMFGAFVDQVG